jgi:hypothetical protein
MPGRSLALFVLVMLSACGATDDQLRARAAFDLDCPGDHLTLVQIDDRTQGVKGCGQKATYVESCGAHSGYGKTDCTWVLNTDSRKLKPSKDDE